MTRRPSGIGCGGWIAGLIVITLIAGLIFDDGGEDEREGGKLDRSAQRDERDGGQRGGSDRGGKPDRARAEEGDEDGGGAPGIPAGAEPTTVREVTDGDTVVLAGLGSSRLIGVDTPEVYGGAECFGSAASSFTSRKLSPGTSVYYLHGQERVDRYGRDLVYVWLSGGTFFNALLVKQGYATTLTIAPNVDYAGLFRDLARAAREADRGLWAPGACGGGGGGGADGGGGGGSSAATGGDKDCADFSSQDEAQDYFEAKGGPQSDPELLDGDDDGVACETLP